MTNIILPDEEGKNISRRKFLIGSGAAAGALALFGAGALSPAGRASMNIASAQQLNTDLDILQFALSLEHLEAAAYREVLAAGLLTGKALDYFKKFGEHENTHVQFISDTIKKLGGNPVQAQAKYNFPKLNNQDEAIKFFIVAEEIGAGAYLGAAPKLKDKTLLGAAASIHNVEAQHASALKDLVNDPMPSPAFGMPLTAEQVLTQLGPILATTPQPAPQPGRAYTIADPAPNVATATNPVAPVANKPDMVFFPETKHTLGGIFLTYWNRSGGLLQYGYPITEPYRGTNPTDGKVYVQQFFQRNRFEFHPENPPQFQVLLGLLGAEQLLQAQKCP